MRYLTPEILETLKESGKMVFIAGPRQVGKTTLLKHLLHLAQNHGQYFNWDIDEHRKSILKHPTQFWETWRVPARQKPRLGLDEIHKYPRWKRFLKGLYDKTTPDVEMIVTGSGRLDIYQRGGDSLLGRYDLYHLHPFTVGEWLAPDRKTVCSPHDFWKDMDEPHAFTGAYEAMEHIEHFSGFPEPLFSGSDRKLNKWRRTYHHLVVREDLRDLTRIRDIGLMESLIALLPERIGSPLSLNALSHAIGVAFNTVRLWIEALARLYYLFEIRPYAGKLSRTLHREAKIYLLNPVEIQDPGAKFENLVALHLYKLCESWNDFGFGDFNLHYVRDKEKREVDFLVTQRQKPYLLLETKLSDQNISPSLYYFRDRLKPKYAVQLVRQGLEKKQGLRLDGILLLNAAQFLSKI